MNKYFLILLLIFSAEILSQNFQREISSIPFFRNDTLLTNTFSGGRNNLEPQFIDIDGDNDFDLFFVDSDDTFGWYKNIGDSSSPNFEYQIDFIEGLTLFRWFYFVDMDNDGDYDCFTGTPDNFIRYYKNIGTKFSPSFIIGIDTLRNTSGEIMMGEPGSNGTFVDVDADGDYDFVSGNSAGSVTFYENTGSSSAFQFQYITSNWKDILIIGTLDHGASSIDFKDLDTDGDYDIIWGDFFGTSLYYLQNTGTAANAQYTLLHRIFPQNADSLTTSGFNMPRLVDIDADGDYDLFVTVLYDPTVPQSLIYFENVGNKFVHDFRRKTFDFIPTLDDGIQTVPSIADIDGDGDKDLFLGYGNNPSGSVAFYKRETNLNHFHFVKVTNSFASVSSELSNAAAFGDIDNDGDLDMFIGKFDGTILLYKNLGTQFVPNFTLTDTLKNASGVIIDIGLYARPFLIDVDSDGDLDLITGRFNGRLSFFRNTGSANDYIFTEETNYFGTIDVGDNSAPILFDYDNDSRLDLFIGNRAGSVQYFRNEGTNSAPAWNLVSEKFLNFTFGGEAVPCFTDIDGDGDFDFFVGNYKGGLYFFRNQTIVNVDESNFSLEDYFLIDAYPNPFNPEIKILIKNIDIGEVKISIYNFLGECITNLYNDELNSSELQLKWNAVDEFGNPVTSGIYFIRVSSGTQIRTKKILFLK